MIILSVFFFSPPYQNHDLHPAEQGLDTTKREADVFEILQSETVFENERFSCPKTPFTCGRKALLNEEKIIVFKNIEIRVDGT